jgi:hypothetical protein
MYCGTVLFHALPMPCSAECSSQTASVHLPLLQDAWETGVRHRMKVFDGDQEVGAAGCGCERIGGRRRGQSLL